MHGSFQNNLAQIDFDLFGIDKRTSGHFTGIIDTGFNGYLQIPMVQALPLGLKLVGVMPSMIANGQTVFCLLAEGYISFNGGRKKINTTISLQDGQTVLIGTQLLKTLGQNIVFDFVGGTFKFIRRKQPTSPATPTIK